MLQSQPRSNWAENYFEMSQMAFSIISGIGCMGPSQRRQGHEIEPRWAQTGKLEIETQRSTCLSWKRLSTATPSLGLGRKFSNFPVTHLFPKPFASN